MPVLFWIDITVYAIAASIAMALSFFIISLDLRNRLNIFFSLFALAVCLWSAFSLVLRFSLWLKMGNSDFFGEFSLFTFICVPQLLLLFANYFVQKNSRLINVLCILGFVVNLSYLVPPFRHAFAEKFFLGENGTTHYFLTDLGKIMATIPVIYFTGTLVLFWKGRKKTSGHYMLLSILIFIFGLLLGGIFDIGIPVLSFTTLAAIGIMGYGAINRQLLNPLKAHNEELRLEIKAREKIEKRLKESEDNFKSILQGIPDAIFEINRNGLVTAVMGGSNFEFSRPREEILGLNFRDIFTQPLPEDVINCILEVFNSHEPGSIEFSIKSGGILKYYSSGIVFYKIEKVLFILRDVSTRKTLEAQLQQSQKLEAIGRLSGGIAHDFNNILTVIMTSTDLALEEPGISEFRSGKLLEIKHAVNRAAEMTNQLLAFSKKQVLNPQILSLNKVISGMKEIIERLIGENIQILMDFYDDPCHVSVNPGQIQQVIINLCVNARDAMGNDGKILFKTRALSMDENSSSRVPGLVPGEYIVLSVTDTGVGISAAEQKLIFDPFFTTKEKGTGLGLSTVYGIVKQCKGGIWIDSEPGMGSTFHIYLPRVSGAEAKSGAKGSRIKRFERTSTVLLVEDDEQIRTLLNTVLNRCGCSVYMAENASEAEEIFSRNQDSIDLLVSDIVIPGKKNGFDLGKTFQSQKSGLKVLYISGYTDVDLHTVGVDSDKLEILQKPFDMKCFIERVQTVLGKECSGQEYLAAN
ncbi:MAG: response regulator [Spirochaetales bacterium]|nr:response regulator [Spirochaetales bacterium]